MSQVDSSEVSRLLAYLEGEPDDRGITMMARVTQQLADQPVTGQEAPAHFVNEGVELERTVGVVLFLPRPSGDLDTERSAYSRVQALVSALEQATTNTDHVVAFELDGEVVGWIENGHRDQLLQEGLLIPWRQRIHGS